MLKIDIIFAFSTHLTIETIHKIYIYIYRYRYISTDQSFHFIESEGLLC